VLSTFRNSIALSALACLTLSFVLAQSVKAQSQTLDYTVNGTAQPWNYVDGGLNTNFQFGFNDGSAPTLVSGTDGFVFSPGGTFVITYVSGLTSYGAGQPFVDGNGDPLYAGGDVSTNPINGGYAPSHYVDPALRPVSINALIGTFADSSGDIVGTPFAIKNGPYDAIVPNGATRLQIGINDIAFSDNTGFLTVSVTGPIATAVPEPGSGALLVTSVLTGAGFLARRRKNAHKVA
jgi:hypothetical protein